MASPHSLTPLNRETIVRTALAIADTHGLEALSMRRLAAELGSGAMSLYRHVDDKDALLGLMADEVLGELPILAPDEPWQTGLERFFSEFYDLLMHHPVVAEVMVQRPVNAPQLTVRGEHVLACMAHDGVADATAVEALLALTWYVLGAAQYAGARAGRRDAAHGGGRFAHLPPEQFPTLARVGSHFDTGLLRDQFRNGLRHLIQGYEAT